MQTTALQAISDLVARRYLWASEEQRSQAISVAVTNAINWDEEEAECVRKATRDNVIKQVASHTMSVEEGCRLLCEEAGPVGYLLQDALLERAWRDALKVFQSVFRRCATNDALSPPG